MDQREDWWSCLQEHQSLSKEGYAGKHRAGTAAAHYHCSTRYIHACTVSAHLLQKEQNLGRAWYSLKYGPKQGTWGKSEHLPHKYSPDITQFTNMDTPRKNNWAQQGVTHCACTLGHPSCQSRKKIKLQIKRNHCPSSTFVLTNKRTINSVLLQRLHTQDKQVLEAISCY